MEEAGGSEQKTGRERDGGLVVGLADFQWGANRARRGQTLTSVLSKHKTQETNTKIAIQ